MTMQTLRKSLKYIGNSQSPSQPDKCRLFYDGTIRTRSLIPGGGEGWFLLAAKIPGAGPMFTNFFNGNEERYLKMRDLRQALELRDQMLIEATQEQTLRTMRKMVRKEFTEKQRKAARSAPRLNVTAIKREEPKEEKTETEEEDRSLPVMFL